MSQGRDTQARLNILTAVTLAVAIAFGFCLVTFGTVFHPVIFGLFGLVVGLGLVGVFAHRCRQCGHDVTRMPTGCGPTRAGRR